MSGKRKRLAALSYNKDGKIPVIRSSICTGGQVAGSKDPVSRKFEELMLIRNDRDLSAFLGNCVHFSVKPQIEDLLQK